MDLGALREIAFSEAADRARATCYLKEAGASAG
jgi:hypothetical protein